MTKSKKTSQKTATEKRPVSTRPRGRPPALPEADRMTRLFGLHTILGRPVYLTRSDWLEHIPFAFWLMEAQRPGTFVEMSAPCGAAYFAFCQAAERLGLDTSCYSIRDWPETEEGDAGLARLERHNAAQYSAFSSVLRGRFDEAPRHFAPASVDLLHIDGLPAFHEVRGAFDSWLPTLSDRAVVILHDSNRRARGYGVARLVDELRDSYPVFEFKHGHGLAVIGVGPDRNEALRRLFEAETDPAARSAIHSIFGRLGRACADSFDAQEYQTLYRQSRTGADTAAARVAEPEPETEPVSGPVSGPVPGPASGPASGPAPDPAGRSGSPEPDAPALRAVLETKTAALAAVETRAAALETQNAALLAALARARDAAADPAMSARPGTETAEAELRRLQSALQERFEEIAALTRSIYDLEEEKRALADRSDAAERHAAESGETAAALRQALEEKERNLEDLRRQHAEESAHRQEFERRFNAVLASTSWRITGPVRGLLNAVRGRH